jgi:hypothetical protein
MSQSISITSATTFQQRMYERVKESLGELLTAEEARDLVDKAIDQSLMQPRIEPQAYGRDIVHDSEFVLLVRNQVEPLVKEAIEQWIADNQEQVKEQQEAEAAKPGAGAAAWAAEKERQVTELVLSQAFEFPPEPETSEPSPED